MNSAQDGKAKTDLSRQDRSRPELRFSPAACSTPREGRGAAAPVRLTDTAASARTSGTLPFHASQLFSFHVSVPSKPAQESVLTATGYKSAFLSGCFPGPTDRRSAVPRQPATSPEADDL